MVRGPTVIASIAVVLLVVAFLLWWPSLLQAVQTIHGPLGGGPAMYGIR
jgi:hypothetical protein